jgi:hypothetical protein
MAFVHGAGDKFPLIPWTRLLHTVVADVALFVRRLVAIMTRLAGANVEDFACGTHDLVLVSVNSEGQR